MSGKQLVFKFCSSDGCENILQNNAVFVTSPLDLNDPYEMRPAWTDEHEERFRKDQELRNKIVTGMPVFATMKTGLQPIGTMPPLKEPPIGEVETHRGLADLHNAPVFRRLHEKYRVLSFATQLMDPTMDDASSDVSATLMWAHYADQFQGACIILDSGEFQNGIHDGGFIVRYESLRRSLPPSWYDVFLKLAAEQVTIGGLQFVKNPETGIMVASYAASELEKQHFLDLLTHKSPAWEYEHELRMIYHLDALLNSSFYRKIKYSCHECKARNIDASDCNTPLYRDSVILPPEAIRGVIFGTEMPSFETNRILTILNESRYSHVARYWSSHHSEHYRLHYSRDDKKDYTGFIQEMRTKQVAEAKEHFRFREGRQEWFPARKGVNFDLGENAHK